MKIGSLVECVEVPRRSWDVGAGPKNKEICTVHGFVDFMGVQMIELDEYPTAPYSYIYPAYAIEFFREIEIPPSLEQEITELLSEPVEA